MTDDTNEEKAMKMLMDILQAQPHFLHPRVATQNHGKELSEFVQGFVKTHAEYFKSQQPAN